MLLPTGGRFLEHSTDGKPSRMRYFARMQEGALLPARNIRYRLAERRPTWYYGPNAGGRAKGSVR